MAALSGLCFSSLYVTFNDVCSLPTTLPVYMKNISIFPFQLLIKKKKIWADLSVNVVLAFNKSIVVCLKFG